ncbi:unnamed protein product [Rhizophagus irregularis]|uniref:Uncharacterized protein n=1 Tax=Rhizophagus irregularis TaxID=588596 RepID=A0A915ZPX6_9GLOM|nr:unnamed protein product [Rhizophagus irregularis]CAB5385450.1 unnamed protein product [Rhizophagus irregularis]
MSRSIGPNEDHKGDIRLLGAWNSDSNIRRRVSSLDFKRRSALRIFRDGFRFRLRILALDMVFPVSGILEIKFRSYFSFGISNMPKWVLEDLLDQVPLECGNGFG